VPLNPVGHSVDQLFTVPLAVQGHERLHSSTYNLQPRRRIFIPRFSKKGWRSNDFWVSLYLPRIFYQRAWARRQIDAAEPRLYPAIYPAARNPENSQKL
jgi:hypothetical protein